MTTPHIKIILELNTFHVFLFYNRDFEYTWMEHHGFTGHIDYSERLKYRVKREAVDMDLLKYVTQHRNDFPILEVYFKILEILYSYFRYEHGEVQHNNKTNIEYFLLTGFSRSGGTYLLKEYGKMRNIDILKEHIAFSHDFYPNVLSRAAFDYKNMLDDLHVYFGSLIAYNMQNGRNSFFKRSTLGGFLIPYILDLENFLPGFILHWKHIIRDLNGIIKSIKQMYSGVDALSEISKCFKPNSTFETEYANYMILWFMCNTSILPTVRGLPFWDVKINPGDNIQDVKDFIVTSVDHYIANNSRSDHYRLGKPAIIKFGKQVEEICNLDGKHLALDKMYTADKFNFKSVPEIDDKYTEVYYLLLRQLKRLYNHFGISFDGELDHV